MTMIKICGIKDESMAVEIAKAGADFIGMVFAPSSRQVTSSRATKIITALEKAGCKSQTVGVFVNARSVRTRALAERCGLDWVQFSGDQPWETCRELARPVIKVIHMGIGYNPGTIIDDLAYGSRILGDQKHMFLLDSNVAEMFGGTGVKFDWHRAQPIAARFPVIIAGGLAPDNVAEAIKTIRPWGVDVSSGVETKGVKDMNKIVKFIEAVRNADASQA